MKKIIVAIFVLFEAIVLNGQTLGNRFYFDSLTVAGKANYEILKNTQSNTSEQKYKLYKTQNIWTFLELNTCNGEVYKVQWTIDRNKHDRFVKFIGSANNMGNVLFRDYYPGRFELYDTDNIYNFILLDTYSGKTWQVQWGIKDSESFVIPIDF